jgi:hypothetical protein
MKKRLLALLLVIASVLAVFTSCDLLFGKVDDSGNFTVVVENSDGSFDVFKTNLEEIENNKEGAKGVLEHLNSRNDRLYLEMVDSTYGAYVSAIGSIRESTADKMYVIVYTSVATDSYDGAPTIQYDGVTLYQAGVGLSGMSVNEGGIILFRLEKSPY